MSEAILKLVALARDKDLKDDFGDWSKASVYWFENLMPRDVREAGEADSSLEYFTAEGSPHTPMGEGFIDRSANTAVSFYLQFKEIES
jgi:hypothetical protein